MKKTLLFAILAVLCLSSCYSNSSKNNCNKQNDTLSYIEKRILIKCDSMTKGREAIYKPLYFSKEYAIDVSRKDTRKLYNAISNYDNFVKCIVMPLNIMKYEGSPSDYLKLAQFMDEKIKKLGLPPNTYVIFHRCLIKDKIKGVNYTELLAFEIDSTKTKIIGVCDETISEK